MNIVVLGAGIAGLSAGYHLKLRGLNPLLVEKAESFGGLCRSQNQGHYVYDFGVKVSFTTNLYVKKIFEESVDGDFVDVDVSPMNFWNGFWINHQPQNNLFGLPADVIKNVLESFKEACNAPERNICNYRDWCEVQFGKYFAEHFNHRYTRKFWTVEPEELTADWVGQRFSRPNLSTMIEGSLGTNTHKGHYVSRVRYPKRGGYISFLRKMAAGLSFSYNTVPIAIDPQAKRVTLNNGATHLYDHLISTIPLPELLKCIIGVPAEVLQACDHLKWTSLLLLNFSVDRKVNSPGQWNYYYDEDIPYTRIVYPSKFSLDDADIAIEALQAEVPYSPYKPLPSHRDELFQKVIASIKRTEGVDHSELRFLGEIDVPYGYVIFDHNRSASLKVIHQFLDENHIRYCGRFGEWAYLWSDEALMSGKNCAEALV